MCLFVCALDDSEKAIREANSAKEIYNRSHDLYLAHTKQCDEEVARLQQQLVDVVNGREKAESLLRDMQEQNKELRLLIDKYRAQMENHRAQISNLTRSFDHDLSQQKGIVTDLTREVAEKARHIAKLQKEVADIRQQQSSQLDADRSKYVFDNAQYLHKVQDYEAMINSLQKDLNLTEIKSQEQLEQLREKYNNVQQVMETRRQAEAEKNRQLIIKLK